MHRAYESQAVRRAEEPLLAAGEALMQRASYALAQAAIAYLRRGGRVAGSRVLVLVGPGNNGGDALCAAAHVARRGADVTAILAGKVHAQGREAARRAGVTLLHFDGAASPSLRQAASEAALWIDGLLGIGVRGGAREPLASWIAELADMKAGGSSAHVIAVDVPSGVGVDDASLPGPVIFADETVAMGCLKPAHLLPPAQYACGEVGVVDLGLEVHLPAEPTVASLEGDDVAGLWLIPGPNDHKYTRGVVGLLTGSERYPGAGVLSAAGALGGGPGMIRYVGHSPEVVRAFPEIVPGPGRVQAWVIGSGLTELDSAASTLAEAVEHSIPVVLDAGAIALLADRQVPQSVVMTPHAGELAQLLGSDRTRVESHPVAAARRAADMTGATVLAKFATSIVASPTGAVYAQAGAPGWAGTAGSGDVLAGLLGTLLAAHAPAAAEDGMPAKLAAAAAYLHGHAAARAARTSGGGVGHPISALDIAHALPTTIGAILHD
ncbi:NAD(P)H-hydrate epimerase [Trueperella pecoris]|uniref:NAD(P)H-hydrate epimerase n=1 Tax=Trueperella pecoris TaxID=2733571 RepID=UPI00186BA7C0|nr:NAD(P)H-hydrate epimerase [Trueperella pecoris]QOQ38410.1 NAD(P)H-hydrate epimerase [Trueperella pecoris]QTG75008.1 NAD(P)H-hydrate epimerase [Trueperella pecoris]